MVFPLCPVQDIEDITTRHISDSDILERYLLLQGSIGEQKSYIHAIYAPTRSQDRPSFFDQLPRYLDENAWHISMGDFNLTLHAGLDQQNAFQRASLQGRAQLLDWMHEFEFVDSWRLHHPEI
ncbi:TPA: hypothetical protein N0F65_009092 [Lagenidium giganteum]|uniref:Endonuclease/exonuclease/phosphatase domain-containing protein n=1 Tax=Lagenidium giganteum TaxID=4803 RepID=A0AAV2YPI3_9STRA|nr:TPA: hypothetical protein N0F65_009092 [Lagenidium giganteum]